MSVLKRITQSTFDEVVTENMEEFDMNHEDAITDAIQQFKKQGIDLSNIDTTTGEGRKELLAAFEFLNTTPSPSEDVNTVVKNLEIISESIQRKHLFYRRNVMLMYHQGGLNALHAHLDLRESPLILSPIIQMISDLSSANIDIRDFFEPGGASKMTAIITKFLSLGINSSSDRDLLILSLNLCRIVARSERNKSKSFIALNSPLLMNSFSCINEKWHWTYSS